MNLHLLRNLFIFSLTIMIAACGGSGGESSTPPPFAPNNINPTVNLGDDRVVIEQDVVSITANANDEDGVITNYNWAWISDSNIPLTGNGSTTVSFTAPQLLNADADRLVLSLQLIVTDDGGAQANDTLMITVTRSNNLPPIANAGNNQQILWGETVTIRGSASDEDGSITSIQWVQTSGHPIDNLLGADSDTVTFDAPEQNTNIVLTMTVTDNNAATASDSVTITVVEVQDSDNDGITDDIDVDDDNNGLIEISTLEELDWIRNNMSGTSLKAHSSDSGNDIGCPITGCNGYELVADLDFDTNNDGFMNEGDTYYDYHGDGSNKGWLPIGTSSNPFVAIFEGNRHAIINLYINRPDNDSNINDRSIGLFGHTGHLAFGLSSELRNVSLTGNLMSVTGGAVVGSLAGETGNTTISSCSSSGRVETVSDFSFIGGLVGMSVSSLINTSYTTSEVIGDSAYAGGLVGQTIDSTIASSYARGTVQGAFGGGLIGNGNIQTILNASYFSGSATGSLAAGGLVGYDILGDAVSISASYWATDGNNPDTAIGGRAPYNGNVHGVLLSELKCPESANNSTCVFSSANVTLYEGWDSLALWIFGTDQELPRFAD